jgi:hypothetical protein
MLHKIIILNKIKNKIIYKIKISYIIIKSIIKNRWRIKYNKLKRHFNNVSIFILIV